VKKARRPKKPWTHAELARLRLPPPGTKEHENFKKRYLAATGYAHGERIPLVHALELFSGIDRPARARKVVTHWLAAGIPSVDHQKAIQRFVAGEFEFAPSARPLSPAEIKEFFTCHREGFNSWNYLDWAVTLAQTRAAIGATARRKNLEKARRIKTVKKKLERSGCTFAVSSPHIFLLWLHIFCL
jgi:hypothetical protein